MTEVAEPSNLAAVRPARAPRRGPTDLPSTFVDRALVDRIAGGNAEVIAGGDWDG